MERDSPEFGDATISSPDAVLPVFDDGHDEASFDSRDAVLLVIDDDVEPDATSGSRM